MDNNVLEFLEAYKKLDELCKQILSSEKGVTEYINQMNEQSNGKFAVRTWEVDYKQLKRMRWIRNQLVHDVDSFDNQLFEEDDIQWLHSFTKRILECKDPFSLLHSVSKHERTNNIRVVENSESFDLSFIVIGAVLFIIFLMLVLIYIIVY